MQPVVQRLRGVETMRVAAIVAVICIHTTPFGVDNAALNLSLTDPGWLINQASRFAVPFFFIMSGFFWARKLEKGGTVAEVSLAMAKRILLVLLGWCLIYLLPYDIGAIFDMGLTGPLKMTYWNINALLKAPWRIVLEGTKYHLWFLLAILWALGISAWFIARDWLRPLVAVSIVLYVIGLLMKAYADTPLGLNTVLQARNGPFFGTVFFVTGIVLAKRQALFNSFWLGALMLVAGFALQLAETVALWRLYGTSPVQDFTVGTYFMGLGAALMAMSNHRALQNNAVSSLGKYTLGIYAVHMIFVEIFKHADQRIQHPLWEVGNVAVVFGCSLLAVLLMARHKGLAKIVT